MSPRLRMWQSEWPMSEPLPLLQAAPNLSDDTLKGRLFSLKRSRATNIASTGVHLCCAFSIELLQSQITLVLHHSSLLEVCDLYIYQHSSLYTKFICSLERHWTHPTTCACALKFFKLRRAHSLCLVVLSYTVDDAVAIQALEEVIAAIPALLASSAIWCYEAAILRCGRWRR